MEWCEGFTRVVEEVCQVDHQFDAALQPMLPCSGSMPMLPLQDAEYI